MRCAGDRAARLQVLRDVQHLPASKVQALSVVQQLRGQVFMYTSRYGCRSCGPWWVLYALNSVTGLAKDLAANRPCAPLVFVPHRRRRTRDGMRPPPPPPLPAFSRSRRVWVYPPTRRAFQGLSRTGQCVIRALGFVTPFMIPSGEQTILRRTWAVAGFGFVVLWFW